MRGYLTCTLRECRRVSSLRSMLLAYNPDPAIIVVAFIDCVRHISTVATSIHHTHLPHSHHSHLTLTLLYPLCSLTYSSRPNHGSLWNCWPIVSYPAVILASRLLIALFILMISDSLACFTLWIWLSHSCMLVLTSTEIEFNKLSTCSRLWFIACLRYATVDSVSALCSVC
jgi:hypothetical protein